MVDIEPFATGNGQSAGVESQQVQDRRMQVCHVMRMFDRMEPQLIGSTMDHSTPDAVSYTHLKLPPILLV